MKNIDEVNRYLLKTYENYPKEILDESTRYQVETVLYFYGFDGMMRDNKYWGYRNPYSYKKVSMKSYQAYIEYLLEYREEN